MQDDDDDEVMEEGSSHHSNVAMTPQHRQLLKKQRVFIVTNFDASDAALDHLYKRGILTSEHYEIICKKKLTNEARCRELLDYLPYRGQDAFNDFIDILNNVTDQAFIADVLELEEVCILFI